MLYLNKRQLIVTRYLINSAKPLTSNFLAIILGSSDKTIKNDMRVLADILVYFGAELISKSGTGYYLNIVNHTDYASFVQLFNQKYRDNYFFPVNNSGRVSYIINCLITAKGYIKTEQLQEELYVSHTTISSDIKDVRFLLRSYKLSLKIKPNYGICLEGSEIHIRFVMADYMDIDEDDNTLAPIYKYSFDINQIKPILIRNMNEMNILISTSSVNKIANLIIISDIRNKNGNLINFNDDDVRKFSELPEYILIKETLENIKLSTLAADPMETAFLAMSISSRRVFKEDDPFDIRKEKNIYTLSNHIQSLLYEQLGIDLFDNTDLKIVLCKHLRGLLIRLEYGIEKKDLPLLSIKQSSIAYEIAVLTCNFISDKYGFIISEAEISYMTYIFDIYYTQYIAQRKYKVLLTMASGLTVAAHFKEVLQVDYKNYIESIQCIEFYQLNYTNVDNFDCILTDMPIIQFESNIPVLQFNTNMDLVDKNKLNRFFINNRIRSREFLHCFNEDLFFTDVHLSTKEEILRYLCEALIKRRGITEDLYQMVKKRESISSTESEHCVALPHTLYFADKYTYIAACIIKRPILWGKENVQLVFLTVNGQYDTYPFLNLGVLKKILLNKDLVYNIIKKANFSSMLSLIKSGLS